MSFFLFKNFTNHSLSRSLFLFPIPLFPPPSTSDPGRPLPAEDRPHRRRPARADAEEQGRKQSALLFPSSDEDHLRLPPIQELDPSAPAAGPRQRPHRRGAAGDASRAVFQERRGGERERGGRQESCRSCCRRVREEEAEELDEEAKQLARLRSPRRRRRGVRLRRGQLRVEGRLVQGFFFEVNQGWINRVCVFTSELFLSLFFLSVEVGESCRCRLRRAFPFFVFAAALRSPVCPRGAFPLLLGLLCLE